MSNIFEKYAEKAKNEFMDHVCQEVRDRFASGVTIELSEYKEMRINSYSDKFIEPLLSDECLIWKVENAIKNSLVKELGSYTLPRHYDEYIQTDGVRELIKRLKLKLKQQEK